MQSLTRLDSQNSASENDREPAADSDLGILRDVLRMLPSGVTVQDEQGHFLLVNDAAAAQFGIAAADPAAHRSEGLDRRREAGSAVLRSGRATVAEECIGNGAATQVFLTSHFPVRIAGRSLLLSSSADISEQKAVEDQLFRSAYY